METEPHWLHVQVLELSERIKALEEDLEESLHAGHVFTLDFESKLNRVNSIRSLSTE